MPMKKLFLFILLVSAVSSQATNYYISKSLGSNTNNGTSKVTPWASAPGMPSCNNNCASYVNVSTDNFILYGGDTWTPSDLGWTFTLSGTHTLGVDITWFNAAVCGGTFCAPIFDCQLDSTCGLNIQALFGRHAILAISKNNAADNNITVDTFEFKGIKIPSFTGSVPVSTAPGQFDVNSVYVQGGTAAHPNNVTVYSPYCHGWGHAPQSENNGPTYGTVFCVYANTSNGGTTNNTNVLMSPLTLKRPQCQGDDESPTPDMGWCWGGGVRILDSAYMYKVANQIDASHNTMTNNSILSVVAHYVNPNITSQAAHCDLVQHISPVTGSTVVFAYNYISDDSGCSGTTIVGINQTAGGTGSASNIAYIHDNVITNVSSNQIAIITGGHGNIGPTLLCSYGLFKAYNNTVYRSGGTGAFMGNGEASTAGNCGANVPRMTDTYANNHFINASGTLSLCDSSGAACSSDGGNLQWSTATATLNGYNVSQTWPFSPTANNSPTVGQGLTKAALDNAGYNTATPSVDTSLGGSRNQVARPTIAQWDIGAYQFSANVAPSTVTLEETGTGAGTFTSGEGSPNIQGTYNGTIATCTHGTLSADTKGCFDATNYPNNTNITTISFTATGGSTITNITSNVGGCTIINPTLANCSVNTGSGNVTIIATLAAPLSCSLTASTCGSVMSGQSCSITAAITGLTGSGPGSFWLFGDANGNSVIECDYPFSGCSVTGQVITFNPTTNNGSGNYTLDATGNGQSCTTAISPMVVNQSIDGLFYGILIH